MGNFGGVILSKGDNSDALGIFGVGVNVGGCVHYYNLYNFAAGGGTEEKDVGTTKWGAVYHSLYGLKAGFYHFPVYLVAGALDEVTAKMDQIYGKRSTIPGCNRPPTSPV